MSSERLGAESGAALIEATLVLPLVILLLFGFVDLALYGWQRNAAAKAVQLGLRRAVVSSPVARGPGLAAETPEAYWGARPPGFRCDRGSDVAAEGCPRFEVRCNVLSACTCAGDRCDFGFATENLAPVLAAMQAAAPGLRAENVEIGYGTSGLGYVGRPGAVPVDVTVRLLGFSYRPLFVGLLFRGPIELATSATAPGEDLWTDR